MNNLSTEGPGVPATDTKIPAQQESAGSESDSAWCDQSDQPEIMQSEAATPVSSEPEDAGCAGSKPTNDDASVDARTRANRQNARKSTGAKTEAGRAASSQNAVKHGLFAQDLSKYMRAEEFERYQLFINGIVGDLKPVGDFETVLARRAADIQFRLEMLRNAEFLEYSGGGIVANTMAAHISKHRDPIGLRSVAS
jgi:hypothetical protein